MTERVTYVVPRFLPSLGGIENHVAAVGGGLRRLGWSVEVATQLESQPGLARRETRPDGIEVVRFASRLPLFEQGVSLGLARYARHESRHGELVHLHNYHALTTLIAGRSVVSRADTASSNSGPVVITPHYLGVGHGPAQQAMHAAYARAFGPIFHRVDAVVAVCASEAELLHQHFGVPTAKIAVIANGVDAHLLATAQPYVTGRRVILVAGRLVAYKGHLDVVRALAGLGDDYELVVAGRGPLERELLALAADLGVSHRLRMLGRLSVDELARWYASAEVVVSMSARECFGLTLVEAIAAGAPIVASDIGAHRDVVALCRYPGDALVGLGAPPQHLADAIRAASERGRHRPGSFPVPHWQDIGQAHAELYRRLT